MRNSQWRAVITQYAQEPDSHIQQRPDTLWHPGRRRIVIPYPFTTGRRERQKINFLTSPISIHRHHILEPHQKPNIGVDLMCLYPFALKSCPKNSRNPNCHSLYLHVRYCQNPLQNLVLSTNNSQKEGSTAWLFRDEPVIKKWLALRFITGFFCSTIPLKGRVVKW